MKERFRGENMLITKFQNEVWVACPSCHKRAVATVDHESKKARLLYAYCDHHRKVPIQTESSGVIGSLVMASHRYFAAELSLSATSL